MLLAEGHALLSLRRTNSNTPSKSALCLELTMLIYNEENQM